MVRYYCILGHNNCSSGGSWCNLLGRSLAKTWTLNIGSVVRLKQNQWIEKKNVRKKNQCILDQIQIENNFKLQNYKS